MPSVEEGVSRDARELEPQAEPDGVEERRRVSVRRRHSMCREPEPDPIVQQSVDHVPILMPPLRRLPLLLRIRNELLPPPGWFRYASNGKAFPRLFYDLLAHLVR